MFKNQALLKPALFKDQGVPMLFPWHWAADLQEETVEVVGARFSLPC